MKWQEKVRLFCKLHPMSQRHLAQMVGMADTSLGYALDKKKSWNTVQAAIKLAKTMGTTVEYLFDENTTWPMDDSDRPRSQTRDGVLGVAEMAIASLERMGASEELAKLTSELLRAGEDGVSRKEQIVRRRRKR